MEMIKIQDKVNEFNKTNNMELTPLLRILDISSEVGEINKEVLLGTSYGQTEYKNTDNMKFEVGDALYSLISFANETGINLEECLQLSISKMESRIKK